MRHISDFARDIARKNKGLLILLYLVVTFIIIFLSYNFNIIVQAGYPGQFDKFQSGSEKAIYDFVQLKMSNPNSSNFLRPFEYALHARTFAFIAQELQKSTLSNFRLSDKSGFLESFTPLEISQNFQGYIALKLGMKDELEIGDVIIFEGDGPRIVKEIKEKEFKESIYLNKTITAIEIPSGFILNRSRSNLPTIEHKMNVSLNKSIIFLGYNISDEYISPGQTFSITYYWKSIKGVLKDYRIFVHFVPATSSIEINRTIKALGHNIFFRLDHEPLNAKYPTSKWSPGEVIVERFEYTMPKCPDGTYEIKLNMFDNKGRGEYLEIDQNNESDKKIRAGSIKIIDPEIQKNLSQSIILGGNGRSYLLKDFFLYLFFYFIHIMLVLVTSFLVIALVYLIYENFGWGISLIYFWILCSSDWLIFYARNYYWIFFLYLIPFVLSLWLYPRWSKSHKWLFYAAIFSAVLMRSLIDFEYITNIILMPLVPIIYFDALNKESPKKIVQDCFATFISGMAGFFAGLSFHIISLYSESSNNFGGTISAILTKILDRTGVDNSYAKDLITGYAHPIFNQIYPYSNDAISQILYIVDNRISYEQVNFVTVPIFHWTIPLYLIELVVLLICYWEIKGNIKGDSNRKVHSLCLATIASFIASNSWAILTANGHMKYHLHMNPIIFYLPFLLTAFILISVKLWEGLNAMIGLRKAPSLKKWTAKYNSKSLQDIDSNRRE